MAELKNDKSMSFILSVATVISVEMLFSSMNIIKNRLRNSIGDQF